MAQTDITALLAALGDSSKTTSKGGVFTAKIITLIILILSFAFGVYGSFKESLFNMTDYITFLETYTWFFAPLVISIGAGSATKVITEGIKNKENKIEEDKKLCV